MPELPEIQTITEDLKRQIIGRRFTGFFSDTRRIFPRNAVKELSAGLKGLKIEKIDRRGKNILLYLGNSRGSGKKLLLIHPKLTGRLQIVPDGRDLARTAGPYVRAVFRLDNGASLAFSDLRKFGKIIFGDLEETLSLPDLKNLGADPLRESFTAHKFIRLIKSETRKIKQVLLDQEVVSGIGNIYSDEALWQARIHPFTRADKLSTKELRALFSAIRAVLKKSLALRGSSMRDYLDTAGKSGGYMKVRRVYRREGLPCFRCGEKIQRVKMSVRSAHFCPKCQKIFS